MMREAATELNRVARKISPGEIVQHSPGPSPNPADIESSRRAGLNVFSTARPNMRNRFVRIVACLVVAVAAIYLGDLIVLRLRAATHGQAFGTVTVHRFYRIAQKNGKYELQYDGDYLYDCVHSLFPHAGEPPCWYRGRHTEEWINIEPAKPKVPSVF